MADEASPPGPMTPNGDVVNNELETKEYICKYDDKEINITIIKKNEKITIKSSEYEVDIRPSHLSVLLNNYLVSIDESFEFLKNAFNKNNVDILIIKHDEMKLIIKNDVQKKINVCLRKQKKIIIYKTPDKPDNNSFIESFEVKKEILVNEYYKLNLIYDKNKTKNFIMKQYKENFIKLFAGSESIEIDSLKKCDHKYIVKLLESHFNEMIKFMILDNIDSTLKDLYEKQKKFSIKEIKSILIQLNEALKYLDNNKINNIIISPERIGIINNKNLKTYSIQLIDLFPYYEIKDKLKNNNYNSKIFNYMSPEMPPYYTTSGEEIDNYAKENTLNTHTKSLLWNIGILIYELYFGKFPFLNENNIDLDINNLKKTGNALLDELLTKLLVKNINNRIDWDNYVNHNFFKDIPAEEICESLYGKKINQNTQDLEIVYENIDENNVKKLSEINFINLLKLDLSKNVIKEFPAVNKEHFEKVKFLNLEKNLIKEINNIPTIKGLEYLFLSSNKISNLKSFENKSFDNLSYLSLSNNNITDLSSLNEVNLSNLNVLNLSYNKIKDISILYNLELPFLKELYLNNNEIKEIKGLLNLKIKELEILNLGTNNINDINDLKEVQFKQNIKDLNLSKNPIKKFEDLNLCYFQSLEKIQFPSNESSLLIISLKIKLYGYEFENEEEKSNIISVLFIPEETSLFEISNLSYKDSFKIITNKKVYIPKLKEFFTNKILEIDSKFLEENQILNLRQVNDINNINSSLNNYSIFYYNKTERIVENKIKSNTFFLIKEYKNLHKINLRYNRIPKYLEKKQNSYYLKIKCPLNKVKSNYYNSLSNKTIDNNKSYSSFLKENYYYHFFPIIFLNSFYYNEFMEFLYKSKKYEKYKDLKTLKEKSSFFYLEKEYLKIFIYLLFIE